MKYYLGIDAGGTKTFCLIGDEQGHIKGFGRAGAGNYECEGVEPAAIENRNAVEAALADAGLALSDIAGVGMGIAGADLPEDYVMLEREIYTPLLGDIPRAFRNDSMAGLRGGTRKPYGIVIACGTGCVCAGVNPAGKHARVGGLGDEFGDQCSGSSLGYEGLKAVWRARDGIIGPTLLTERFVERAGCRDIEDFFYKCYRREIGLADLQPMAKIVSDAAFDGDATACDILERGGRYLGKMVTAVARQLDMGQQDFEVVMAGSVFKGRSPVLKDAMRTVIHTECPRAETVMPVFEPVVGALLMGMELGFEISEDVYQTISTELLAAEDRYKVKFRTD
ncbi:MAG TPA: BadF/BadG/BcrA/BcrD ATPase family protein [Candidatus Hydrogenedentes bacterium]|mgnify:CR=1 FL=1|nr:BadF/BadG/BcrA/BcrD ATPase family protein [Candidatus Hydrogenedentota bacterium]HPG69512.1 BadF/BadG/BcrA/BcrD ATPase family protein [Candidatus Hydrogenedentota bacterium]